jgi:LmbE family N-acetylglucosaminyl deacetylase
VVEDDDALGSALQVVLGALGTVRLAATAEQAMAVVASRDWDLILADIELPAASGLDFIRMARRTHAAVATLVLSGHASFEYAVEALRVGADDYLRKPVEPDALVAKARELIALTHRRRAAGADIVLAIGAHPDDVEIGIGGLLLRHVAQGHSVTILTLTGGEAGGVTAERAAESQQAAALLSARLVQADLEDASISEGGATIATIQRVVDEIRPSTLYTHSVHDVHQDHRNVHNASLVAARGVPKVFCYQAPSTSVGFHPTRFVAIDEYLARKLEIIETYTSQVNVRDYLDPELLRATARYWARFSDARYVEPLEVVRDSDPGAASPVDTPVALGADLA